MRFSEVQSLLPEASLSETLKPAAMIGEPIRITSARTVHRLDGTDAQIWSIIYHGDVHEMWGAGQDPCAQVTAFFELWPGEYLDACVVRTEKNRWALADVPAGTLGPDPLPAVDAVPF